jgi:hypothetical protein
MKKPREKYKISPISRAKQYYRQYCISDIRQNGKASIYPDWGILADRYLANKKIDHAARWQKRKESDKKYKEEYRLRPDFLKRQAELQRLRLKNPAYKIRKNLSRRLSEIMNGMGGSSVLRYIGCDQKTLKEHIERQFKGQMTWDNYGSHWHIDHIIPCAAFDHNDHNQVMQCWHWTNLQPLEAKLNISKGDKITHPQMKLLL